MNVQDEGCWEWTACKSPYGYGIIGENNRNRPAHVVGYEIQRGPVPEGLYVCHHCDNPGCVRGDHLFIGTAKENTHDMIRKGRQAVGDMFRHSKLTAEGVQLILNSPLSDLKLAAELGVSVSLIYMVRQGKAWKHISREGTLYVG